MPKIDGKATYVQTHTTQGSLSSHKISMRWKITAKPNTLPFSVVDRLFRFPQEKQVLRFKVTVSSQSQKG